MSDPNAGEIPDWRQVWRTDRGESERFEYITNVLPRYATEKNNKCPGTIDHWITSEIDLAMDAHTMSSILTNCRSVRCLNNGDGDVCYCRYKINTCEVGRTTVVYQQETHVTDDLQAPSPAHQRLTPAMKDVIIDEWERRPAATTQQLFSLIASEIADTDLKGPAPEKSQVEYFFNRWRTNHPGADTRQVAEVIDESLYDVVRMRETTPDKVVYFCDAVRHRNRWVSRIGGGTNDDPYRKRKKEKQGVAYEEV